MTKKVLSIAHSPDPDDAFMFYGITQQKMPLNGYRIKHVLKDIQTLNRKALKGTYHVTAISTAVYPQVADKYWIMSVGSSVGRKYGPVLVCRPESYKKFKQKDWSKLRIAVPGAQTTAFLLLRLYKSPFIVKQMAFDKILTALKKGQVDAGLIIHEGQITYKDWGMKKIVDMGQWWYKKTKLPIPLGLDVVRKDLGRSTAVALANTLTESIRYSYKHKKDAVRYSLKYGRGINAKVGEKFVTMYVNKDTIDMGRQGERAIQKLFKMAREKKLIQAVKPPRLIRPTIGKKGK